MNITVIGKETSAAGSPIAGRRPGWAHTSFRRYAKPGEL